MKNKYDCIIIGAGIAGVTAAIYLKRYNLNILLLEKGMPGGIINKTSIIENYPGLIDIDGPTMTSNLYNQVKKLEIPYEYGNVLEIVENGNDKIIKTDIGEYITKSIIIATGREPNKLELEKEEQLIGHGISYCAICDGPLYKNKNVCIVGGGNSALEEALYLSTICNKVNVINRSDELKADKYLIEKIEKTSNVKVLYNSKVTKLIEKNMSLKSLEINNKENIECDGLFIFIGFTPKIEFIKNLNLITNNGYLVVNKNMETNIKNVCACGDSIEKDLYQIVTAAGEGAVAAHTIKNNLSN